MTPPRHPGRWALALALAACTRPATSRPPEPSPQEIRDALSALRGSRNAADGSTSGCADRETLACIAAYQRSCAAGQGVGCLLLAVLYVQGASVTQDDAKAFELLERGCDTYAPACSLAGLFLARGHGVARDDDRAMARLRRGCDRGDAFGCLQLARMLLAGRGGPAGPDAVAYAVTACDAGELEGCGLAGSVYFAGHGVARDEARAEPLLRRACDGDNAIACTALAMLYDQATTIPRDPSQALLLYTKACDGGHGLACRNLSLMYSEGLVVPRDESRAAELLRTACDLGDTESCRTEK